MSRSYAWIAVASILTTIVHTAARAQGIPLGTASSGQMSDMRGRMAMRAREHFLGETIRVTPLKATVGADQTVTLTVSNPSTDTITARLTAGLVGPGTVLDSTGAPDISAFLPDAPPDIPPHVDSIASATSLAPWVHDLPASVTLLPGQQKTIVVHVVPPKTVTPGDYAAWILATTDFKALNATKQPKTKKLGLITMTTTTNLPKWSDKQLDRFENTLQSGCKVTYHVTK